MTSRWNLREKALKLNTRGMDGSCGYCCVNRINVLKQNVQMFGGMPCNHFEPLQAVDCWEDLQTRRVVNERLNDSNDHLIPTRKWPTVNIAQIAENMSRLKQQSLELMQVEIKRQLQLSLKVL